jgi:hypothetical protein
MMCPAIDNLVSGEIRAVIRLLHAEIMSGAEIHCELWAVVYAQNVRCEGTVKNGVKYS